MKKIACAAAVLSATVFAPWSHAEQPLASDTARTGIDARLQPTNHPRLPADSSELLLTPDKSATRAGDAALRAVAVAIKQQAKGEYTKSLAALSAPSAAQSALGDYAVYYAGVAQLRLGRANDARRTFQSLAMRPLAGYLVEGAALGEGESDEALGESAAAVQIYERLLSEQIGAPEGVLMLLGRAARASGDSTKARQAFARVYYEFATNELASSAGLELARLPPDQPIPASDRYKLDLSRAERLYGARQYAAARGAFEALRPSATEEQRRLLDLRVAECDYLTKRARAARDGLRNYVDSPSAVRRGEALYYLAAALDDLGDSAEYAKTMRRVVDEFPAEHWAEQALDHLATSAILQDDDDLADATFRELYDKYPTSMYAERAAWKIGWRAYRGRQYAETVRVFERAAADFPHSDYRPAWLYWAGVAHQQLNEDGIADERYLLTATDYLNSYYGHLAAARLGGRRPVPHLIPASTVVETDQDRPAMLPPNASVIRALLGADLYDDALNELRFAERTWGDSPAIAATVAWVHQRQGQSETGSKRFTLVRGAITTMRRAYPQFMAAGGEALPRDIQTVIFPLAYWDLIRTYSTQHDLDPYLVAALVAQESTFVPDIKSYAKAVGLMQLMPFTARQYAKPAGVRYSTSMLTNPEANIRMGTAYFAQTIKEFGDPYLALASYNAGESAVRRWIAERPGVPRDEFIDDIPYPQTQNYVKRILGTAEDYRRLYGDAPKVEELTPAPKVAAVPQGVGAPPAPGSAASKPTARKKGASKKTSSKKKRAAPHI